MQPHIDEWRAKGFDVIFVTATSRDSMERFLADTDLQMEVYLDPDAEMHREYSIRALPTTLIVDTSGQIREESLGWGEDSLDQMESWVDSLAPDS